ncbi:MAG: UDP-N-acetylmuramoyl-L-alanine--D-glutamate ligase [Hylemonella sp.]
MSSEELLPPDSAAERAPELLPQAGAGQAWPVQDAPGQELAPSLQAIKQPSTPEHQSMPPSLTAARDAAAFVAQLFAQPANAEPSVSEEEELAEPLTDLPDQQPAEAGVPGEDVRTSLRGLEVLVLGLGASGLAMARWCARQGARVTVADTRASPPQLPSLRQDLPDVKFIGAPFSPDLLRGDQGGPAGGGEIRAVFKSPGLSPLACQPVWQSAQQQGLWLGGELDLFVQALRELQAERSYSPKVLAVSGTNGKTTTTALAAALIGHAGKSVCAAGNIGPSLLDALMRCLDEQALPEVWVLELSSFQLEGVQGFEPLAATVLNLSQDHLDWHGDMQAYAAAKARIFGAQGLMILNRDDPAVMAMRNASGAPAAPARSRPLKLKERDYVSFGGDMPQRPGDYGLEITQGLAWLVRAQPADPALRRRRHEEPELFIQRLIPAGALRIRGRHNATNALAALALAQAAGCSLAPLLFGLREYRGEPHRVEPLGVIQQVEYFDDSKGTNVGATVAALNGLGAERKVVVILGGDGKGQDFSPLASPVAQHARAVVLIGRDAPVIRAALAHSGVRLLAADSLPEAVNVASGCAHAGDAVLLSPACASFDMFDNYEHRAQVFVAAVQALALQAGEVLEARA